MSAQERYSEFTEGCEPLSPIEALRFFCSLTMHGQDWLDVEKFFDAVESELSATQQKLEAAEASIKSWQEQTVTAESAIIRLGDLLERICDIVKWRAPEGEAYSYHDLPEELTKLLADAKSKAVPEWIRVEDELPEDGQCIIGWEDYRKIGKSHQGAEVFFYRTKYGFVARPYDDDGYGCVTHWMPLIPSSPQPETDRGSNE